MTNDTTNMYRRVAMVEVRRIEISGLGVDAAGTVPSNPDEAARIDLHPMGEFITFRPSYGVTLTYKDVPVT